MFGINKSLPKFADLKGKVAIVTGAAKGMGKADSLKLATAGAKVVLTDIDVAGCQLVADEIKKLNDEKSNLDKNIDQLTKNNLQQQNQIITLNLTKNIIYPNTKINIAIVKTINISSNNFIVHFLTHYIFLQLQ